ncbi:MAG: hypothetical protein ACERKV_05250 [Clostridiaceae bacterium]
MNLKINFKSESKNIKYKILRLLLEGEEIEIMEACFPPLKKQLLNNSIKSELKYKLNMKYPVFNYKIIEENKNMNLRVYLLNKESITAVHNLEKRNIIIKIEFIQIKLLNKIKKQLVDRDFIFVAIIGDYIYILLYEKFYLAANKTFHTKDKINVEEIINSISTEKNLKEIKKIYCYNMFIKNNKLYSYDNIGDFYEELCK